MVAQNEKHVKDIVAGEVQISLARLLDLNKATDIRSQYLRLKEIDRLFINLQTLGIL